MHSKFAYLSFSWEEGEKGPTIVVGMDSEYGVAGVLAALAVVASAVAEASGEMTAEEVAEQVLRLIREVPIKPSGGWVVDA